VLKPISDHDPHIFEWFLRSKMIGSKMIGSKMIGSKMIADANQERGLTGRAPC